MPVTQLKKTKKVTKPKAAAQTKPKEPEVVKTVEEVKPKEPEVQVVNNEQSVQNATPTPPKQQKKTKGPAKPKEAEVVTYKPGGFHKQNETVLKPSNWGLVEKVPPPKTASNMRSMFESGNIPDLHGVNKTKVVLKEEEGEGVYENQPGYLEGVARETDEVDPGKAGEGNTAKWLDHWVTPPAEYEINREIKLAADEGRILESEPEVLSNVVRETDYNEELVPLIPDKHARQMKDLWYEKTKDPECAPKRELVRFTPEREHTPI